MVQNVEELGTELHLHSLAVHISALEERNVEVFQAWTTERVAPDVAQLTGLWDAEALQHDVVLGIPGDRVPVRWATRYPPIVIRSLPTAVARDPGLAGSRNVRGNLHTERGAVLSREDSAQLPALQQESRRSQLGLR